MSVFHLPRLRIDSRRLSGLRSWFRSWLRPLELSTDEEPAEPSAQQVPPDEPVRVLVVDDSPMNLLVISALLESMGLSVWLAEDGGEAVALACGMPFDLVLMDLQMPILDGFGATAAIRNFEKSRSRPAVPVVAYSSSAPAADVLIAHGLNGSLSKPCDRQELEDCLVRWCPTHVARSTAHRALPVRDRWPPADARMLGARGPSMR